MQSYKFVDEAELSDVAGGVGWIAVGGLVIAAYGHGMRELGRQVGPYLP